VALFEPTSVDMRIEYPELAGIEEFQGLSDVELKFVWYYFNTKSPYYKEKDRVRKVSACVKASGFSTNLNILKNMYVNIFPENLEAAGARMERFASSARERAKGMIEKMFDTYEGILDSFGEKDFDTEQQEKFVNIAAKIRAELPALIKQKEEGFGLKQVRKAGEKKGMSLADEVQSFEVTDENDTE